MCTVTFIPLGDNNFILTSNRDEDSSRKTISPKEYTEDGVVLTYPKDALAGGTWIGLSNKKRLVCLLNGGFKKHKREDSYKVSRGVVVKDLLKVDDVIPFINEYNFNNIEPFTVVLVDWKRTLQAHELVWDGVKMHLKELGTKPQIWSSSTLYNEDMKELREKWFLDWFKDKKVYKKEDILAFHNDTTNGTADVSIKMKRANVETVSITTVQKKSKNVVMTYESFV